MFNFAAHVFFSASKTTTCKTGLVFAFLFPFCWTTLPQLRMEGMCTALDLQTDLRRGAWRSWKLGSPHLPSVLSSPAQRCWVVQVLINIWSSLNCNACPSVTANKWTPNSCQGSCGRTNSASPRCPSPGSPAWNKRKSSADLRLFLLSICAHVHFTPVYETSFRDLTLRYSPGL